MNKAAVINEGLIGSELNVSMSLPDAGWIRVSVPELLGDTYLRCSYVFDPFPEFVQWLETLANGAKHAVWSIDEEGVSAHLCYIDENYCRDQQAGTLLYLSTGEGIHALHAVQVTRHALVSGFWKAFRAMVTHRDYSPREWEISRSFPVWYPNDDDIYEDVELSAAYEALHNANPYDGYILSLFESEIIEGFVRRAIVIKNGN